MVVWSYTLCINKKEKSLSLVLPLTLQVWNIYRFLNEKLSFSELQIYFHYFTVNLTHWYGSFMTNCFFISMVTKISFSQYFWFSRNWGEIWEFIYWTCWEELITLFSITRLNLGRYILRNYIQGMISMLFLSGKYILFHLLYSS